MRGIVQNQFYCMRCGRCVMTLPRARGRQRERFHRKKLWCPWCQKELNCVEVKNYEEEQEFKDLFSLGVFQEEVEESIEICK